MPTAAATAAATPSDSNLGMDDHEVAMMRRKARLIQDTLEALYPEVPAGFLEHSNPFTLLVAVLLSAQTTDVKVNQVTPTLFAEARDPAAMVALGVEKILRIIKPIGLAGGKAKNIHALSAILLAEHDGQVPQTFEELEKLPGVGHKTASVVMAQAFGKPAFPVDTHIHRLAARWGCGYKTVLKTEATLKTWFPDPSSWAHLHVRLILFGREHCPALRHDMNACPICAFAATDEARAENNSPRKKFEVPAKNDNPYVIREEYVQDASNIQVPRPPKAGNANQKGKGTRGKGKGKGKAASSKAKVKAEEEDNEEESIDDTEQVQEVSRKKGKKRAAPPARDTRGRKKKTVALSMNEEGEASSDNTTNDGEEPKPKHGRPKKKTLSEIESQDIGSTNTGGSSKPTKTKPGPRTRTRGQAAKERTESEDALVTESLADNPSSAPNSPTRLNRMRKVKARGVMYVEVDEGDDVAVGAETGGDDTDAGGSSRHQKKKAKDVVVDSVEDDGDEEDVGETDNKPTTRGGRKHRGRMAASQSMDNDDNNDFEDVAKALSAKKPSRGQRGRKKTAPTNVLLEDINDHGEDDSGANNADVKEEDISAAVYSNPNPNPNPNPPSPLAGGRKRGRPRKTATAKVIEAEVKSSLDSTILAETDMDLDLDLAAEAPPVPKRRRGRPTKASTKKNPSVTTATTTPAQSIGRRSARLN